MIVVRRTASFLASAGLGGALIGSLAAMVDWRRILLNGDFVETIYLHRLWLTVTLAGALAGLALGLLCLPILRAATRRRGRSRPGGFRLPVILAAAILLIYVALRAATPIHEGRLPRLRIDQASEQAGKQLPGDPAGPTSVILIVLDTVRADHLSLHGYHRPTTPGLERLAEESLVCDSARSTASWTLPAHGSLFTGLYPSQHRLHCFHPDDRVKGQQILAAYPLASHVVTLPTLLRQAGFQTAAIMANPILSPHFRVDRGFDFYHRPHNFNLRLPLITGPVLEAAPWSEWLATFRKGTASARQINQRVMHWLDRHAVPPFFLFINYMDAHWPYQPPPPWDKIYPWKESAIRSMNDLRNLVLGRQRALTADELAWLESQYDGEISYLDSQLSHLFDSLRQRNLFDSSLIIITSDHGEFFGEHQLIFHGRELYEGGVKIPLLVKYPRGTPCGRLDQPVGIEDIFPTVLDVLGLPVPEGISGVRLGAPRSSPSVAENYYSFKLDLGNKIYGSRFDRVRRSLVLGRHKFIHSSDGQHELYDLRADPGETVNLLAGNPELAEPFLAHAETLEQAAARPRTMKDLVVAQRGKKGRDDELRKQLAELGYVEEEPP